jgi:hypothetical protein
MRCRISWLDQVGHCIYVVRKTFAQEDNVNVLRFEISKTGGSKNGPPRVRSRILKIC